MIKISEDSFESQIKGHKPPLNSIKSDEMIVWSSYILNALKWANMQEYRH